jgi:hypothetical protein
MSVLTVAPPTAGRAEARARVAGPALLHDGLLAETLTRAYARSGSVVTEVRVGYLEYHPGASLVVQVSAVVDGHPRSAVVRTGDAVTPAVRGSGRWLPELAGVVHWLPSDPSLPLVASTARELYALLPHSLRATRQPAGPDTPARVLAYVPGRRATLALEPYVLKTYASSAAFETARAAMALLGDGRELPTPRQVTALPACRATVQHHVTGTPAGLPQAVALAEPAGELVRRLHRSERRASVRRDPVAQLRDAREAVDVLGAVLPDQRERAGDLLARLAGAAPTDLPLVLSHGDFTIDQLLVTGDGGLVVTDVDNACQAPAALDLASFAANLVSGRDGDDERAYAVLSALVASHGAPPGLAWHFAVALLRRCDRPFRRWKKRWPQKSLNILTMAEEVSTWRD